MEYFFNSTHAPQQAQPKNTQQHAYIWLITNYKKQEKHIIKRKSVQLLNNKLKRSTIIKSKTTPLLDPRYPYTYASRMHWSKLVRYAQKLKKNNYICMESVIVCMSYQEFITEKRCKTSIPCSRKSWQRIKFDKITVNDACIKLNSVNINIQLTLSLQDLPNFASPEKHSVQGTFNPPCGKSEK